MNEHRTLESRHIHPLPVQRRHFRNLEVHHLTYDRLGDERMDDLEVLCPDCHRKAHGAAWPGGGPGSPRTGANGEKVK